MKGVNLLTASECLRLVKDGTPSRHRDGGSLFLEVKGKGRAYWIYRWGKNNTNYNIGTWADFSLKEAREEHAIARAWVREGKNPSQQRKLLKLQNKSASAQTFETIATEWLDSMKSGWSAKHYKNAQQALSSNVFPAIGNLPIDAISTAMIYAALEPLCTRAPETCSRVRQHVGLIFDLAVSKGLRTNNPTVSVAGASRSTGKLKKRQPAITTLPELGEVLRRTESANTTAAVRTALWLLAHVAIRPGELIAAKWSELELDGDNPRWIVPRERMKTKSREHPHNIPLAPQVVTKLKQWQSVAPESEFIFGSKAARNTTGHLSVEALEKAYRVTLELKGKHVPHGWRSAFSTNAHDAIGEDGKRLFDEDVIEVSLDHVIGSSVKQSYDRGERWAARRMLMHWWADQLEGVSHG